MRRRAPAPLFAISLALVALPMTILAQCPTGATCLLPANLPTKLQSCVPLGTNDMIKFAGQDTPLRFSGFIYRNVPQFTLPAGSKIRFNLAAINNVDVKRNIFLAKLTANPNGQCNGGGLNVVEQQDTKAVAWTQVVSELGGSPITDGGEGYLPSGDTNDTTYELAYVTSATFDFPCADVGGCGLAIGFSGLAPNGSATEADLGCELVMVGTTCNDASGKFYASFISKDEATTSQSLDETYVGGEAMPALFPNAINLPGIIFEPAPEQIMTKIDIKFCSNPNAFNCGSSGKTPVTIFGGSGLDVGLIDISTLRLCREDTGLCTTGGPTSWSSMDRGNPSTDLGASSCAVVDGVEQRYLHPDGLIDLDVAFDTDQVASLIGCPKDKGWISPKLYIKGNLKTTGTPIQSTPVGANNIGIDQLLVVNQ